MIGPFLLPVLGIELNVALGNSIPNIVHIINEVFDLRPWGITNMLDLLKPIYKDTASYGHFGRSDLDLSWEKTDKIEIIKNMI